MSIKNSKFVGNDIRVFFRVILPLSKPMLAAVGLFIAVGFWNDYYSYMMYIAIDYYAGKQHKKKPLNPPMNGGRG